MKEQKDPIALKWIYTVAGSGRKWVWALTVIRVLQGVLALLYANTLRSVVDYAATGQGDAFHQTLIVFVILVAATVFLQALGRFLNEKAHSRLDKVFRLRAFSQLLLRSHAEISQVHTGEWMNRITSDTAAVTGAVIRVLPEICGMAVRLLGAFFLLITVVPQVALLLLPAGALMLALSYVLRRRMKRYHKAVQRSDGKARSFLQEQLGSLTVIHTFSREEASARQASGYLERYAAARMKRGHFANLSSTALNLAMTGAQVIGIAVCCQGILDQTISYGTMSAVMYLINLLVSPFVQLSGSLTQYYAMVASAERLMEIEEFPPDCQLPPLSDEAVQKFYREDFQSLGLEDACFAYQSQDQGDVLRHLSLQVEKGEFVAFTGQSGCGKSTALKILLSLYPLSGGSAYLQGKNRRESLDSRWRGLFAYVPQGNQLISGTIRQALTFFDPQLMQREELLHNALRIACADFVQELPQGLDTPLGERGSGLSEGQLQRLAIARAIVSGRPVLLLDESTSALDAATEEQLLRNLRAMTDRTVIIITHREAALSYCDKVIPFA